MAKAKTKRINFTKDALGELIDRHTGKRAVVYDTKQPGLIAELREGGTLTFYLYRWSNGRPARVRIGAFPEVTIDQARDQRRKWIAKQIDGVDLAAVKRESRQEATIKDLFAHWLEIAKQHKKTWAEDKRQYDQLLTGGETDPPQAAAGHCSLWLGPLLVDMARHVRFQDLVIRGGGHNCVVLQMGIDIEFDNVTIFAGTYGLRSRSTGPFRMVHSAIHGTIPPWAWRDENGLYTYTARSYDPFVPPEKAANARNIARLNTHALLVTDGSYEFEVFHYPYNHDWEIAYSEFTDGHDGVYLSGHGIRFHHNLVVRMQDDGIYLSSPTHNFNDNIHVCKNLIRDIFTAFACNNTGGPRGEIFVYRNIIDQRQGVPFNRPGPQRPEGGVLRGHGFLAHGNNLIGIENLHFYHNTFITETWPGGSFAARTWTVTDERTRRTILNNLFVYLKDYPETAYPAAHDIYMDGNLHWCPAADAKLPDGFLVKVRMAEGSKAAHAKYSSGWEAPSAVGDPRFVAFDAKPAAKNDYRLHQESPAVGKGVVLPENMADPSRPAGGAAPDIGAIPLGAEVPEFGRHGREKSPFLGSSSQ
jgi:hypothetical protein